MARGMLIMLGSFAVAALAACGGRDYEARSTTLTSAPLFEREVSSRALNDRVAWAVCLHEANCGRAQSASCLETTFQKSSAEISGWQCDPAAMRARVEECLASIPTESCQVDLTVRRDVCPVTTACSNANAMLTSPGPEIAEVWRR